MATTQRAARMLALAACTMVALAWGAQARAADEVPMVTGKHWTQSSDQLKKAYLLGVANVLQVESAFHAGNPPTDQQSLVPRAARGLRGETLDTVRMALDRYYGANPDKLERPVIEVIWFEVVVPGLRKPA